MEPAGDTEFVKDGLILQPEIDRIVEGMRRRRVRSRWVLLFFLPLLTAFFSHVYYRLAPAQTLLYACAAATMGALLLVIRFLASRHRRPLEEFLNAPGKILGHFMSPDRGLVYFNETGVFLENTHHFWTYDGPRIRILAIDYEPTPGIFRLSVAGVLSAPKRGSVTLGVPDELVVRTPPRFGSVSAQAILNAVRPHLKAHV